MLTEQKKMVILLYMRDTLDICYKISIALLSISILLLLFLIVVTGAEDWVFTLLGWFTLVFSATSAALFFVKRKRDN